MFLFSLSKNKELTAKVAKELNTKVGDVLITYFKDGETLVTIKEDVKDQDVFVIQSIAKPTNESLMELLIFINAAKNAGAKTINVIAPYIGYSRQDRVAKPGEPITSELVANTISSSGATSFLTFDIHTQKTIEYFNIPAKSVSSSEIFAKYYLDLLSKKGIKTNDVVVVSPDHGSYNRAKILSELLPGSTFAIISKYRPKPNEAKTIRIDGDVEDKNAIIIDDIIDTAGTLLGAIDLLKEKGTKSIFVGATHGIFSDNLDVLMSKSDDLVVTDSINQDSVKTISLVDEIVKEIRK